MRAGGAQLVLGGMCWPSLPTNWPGPLGRLGAASTRSGASRRGELPGQVARLTGAPVAHASHVGPITGETPLGPGIPWPTTMIGESQICDRDGTILGPPHARGRRGPRQRRRRAPAARRPLDPIGDRFWIPTVQRSSRTRPGTG